MDLLAARIIHCVGVGGAGISAIARWLAASGATVTGSDGADSPTAIGLRSAGIPVTIGHAAANLPLHTDLVLYSTAVPNDNPELLAAAAAGVPMHSYPQALGELTRSRRTLAVSGTNGKSTTTALLATILATAGADPAAIVGAPVVAWGNSNYRPGAGNLIVEACEHQAHFHELSPWSAAITNITEDHLDFYHNFEAIERAFVEFIGHLPDDGTLVYNADDVATRTAVATAGHGKMLPFSLVGPVEGVPTLVSCDIVLDRTQTKFSVSYGNNPPVAFTLPMPGRHNVANCLAAIGLAMATGLRLEDCVAGVATYAGLGRRLERVGTMVPSGAPVISDYAHHPDAIRACLDTLAQAYPERRLIVLFQPHQGNRTRRLMDQFATAFERADQLIIAEVYRVPGREHGEDAAVSSSQLVDAIHQHQPDTPVAFAEDEDEAERMVRHVVRVGDVVIVVGAGTIDGVARRLVESGS